MRTIVDCAFIRKAKNSESEAAALLGHPGCISPFGLLRLGKLNDDDSGPRADAQRPSTGKNIAPECVRAVGRVVARSCRGKCQISFAVLRMNLKPANRRKKSPNASSAKNGFKRLMPNHKSLCSISAMEMIVFLGPDRLCTVYERRPEVCRSFRPSGPARLMPERPNLTSVNSDTIE